MDVLLVFLTFVFAVFTQTAAGFGVALISMPLLTGFVGLEVAAPLVALVALTTRVLMLLRYRAHINLSEVWRLMAAAVVGIPFGLTLFYGLQQHVVEMFLGVVVILYSVFMLLQPDVQRFHNVMWAYGMGFVSGMLAGAYNIGGPPAVIYATARRWPPISFKGNLQGVSLVSGVLIIATRATNQEFTTSVMTFYLAALPAVALGTLLGFWLDQYINAKRFRQAVQILLMIVGIELIV